MVFWGPEVYYFRNFSLHFPLSCTSFSSFRYFLFALDFVRSSYPFHSPPDSSPWPFAAKLRSVQCDTPDDTRYYISAVYFFIFKSSLLVSSVRFFVSQSGTYLLDALSVSSNDAAQVFDAVHFSQSFPSYHRNFQRLISFRWPYHFRFFKVYFHVF